ncbi:type II toxin-antitoxin system ParD family antitoxin [Methylobacterium sp. A54F]
MADVEHMTVTLTEPMAAQIRASVEAGEYASASEAVRDALRLWSSRHAARAREVADLQRAWDAGKASGSHGELDFADLRREARARLADAERA